MSAFPVNPHRHDPYKNFRFRVIWDGRTVVGVSKVSGLSRQTEVIAIHDGSSGITSLGAGRTSYSPITLERGVTQDPAFEQWADLASSAERGGDVVSLKHLRKDIVIELLNEAGQVVKAYKVFRCWPSKYEAISDLDADGCSVAIETLVLQNEGWERDTSVPEPSEN